LERVAQGAQNDASAISDLNTVMGKNAAREFSATLKDLAANGLPGVEDGLTGQIEALAQLDTKWTTLKQTVANFGRDVAVALGQVVGAIYSNEVIAEKAAVAAAKRDADEKKRLQELAAQRDANKIKAIGAENAKANQAIEDSDKQRAASIAAITVAAPVAADRLARIGGIIGGQSDPNRGMMERQLKETEIIRKATEDVANIMKNLDSKVSEIIGNTSE
jgi:hypothetical protein